MNPSLRARIRRRIYDVRMKRTLFEMALADWRDAKTRDPRIPPRVLNYNQLPSRDTANYINLFTCDSVERELPFFVSQGLARDAVILDYGCGLGRTAYALSNYLSDKAVYHGVDIAPEVIEFLCVGYKEYPNFHFNHLNLELFHY